METMNFLLFGIGVVISTICLLLGIMIFKTAKEDNYDIIEILFSLYMFMVAIYTMIVTYESLFVEI